jgi:hypothetical protein
MYDGPSSKELVEAVKGFLDNVAAPKLEGHAAFHARVASNALGIVLREFEHRANAEAAERARLRHLLGAPVAAGVAELNEALCNAIRQNQVSLSTPGLLAHLKSTTIDQVMIDQPTYSGLETARRTLG